MHSVQSDIMVAGLIPLEVLQGARDSQRALRIEQTLSGFELAAMLDVDLAIEAAANYPALRSLGITIRRCLI